METVFGELKSSSWWSWTSLVVAGALALSLGLHPGYPPMARVLVAFSILVLLSLYLVPAILRAARQGHKFVPCVCTWVTVLLVAFVVVFYYWYFTLIAFSADVTHDRVLNIVPVAAAVVAASLGWYVHYQYSSKAHRTNNAFALVMEMRRSSEFLKRAELVAKHFPASEAEISDDYRAYFPTDSRKRIYATEPLDEVALEKAEAVMALKYLLNYYEFIGAGIHAKDLDEELLMDTVGDIVVGCVRRSRKFIDFIRSPEGQGQSLAFERLLTISASWRATLAKRAAAVQ